MVSLLLLGLFTIIRTTYGLQNAAVFASLGDSVALPCSIPALRSCSEVHWNMSGDFPGLYTEVVRAGVVSPGQPPTVRVGPGCSLHIDHLEHNSARTYVCGDGRSSARLSLEILQMSSKETDVAKGTMEIHCFLDDFKGHVRSCPHQGIRLEWLSEANTTLNRERFASESPTKCFSKLIFKPKLTDHRRTWRCQLRENHTVITSLAYTINITDGIQEVFAVVGGWVSFTCGTSSIAGSRVEWVGPLVVPPTSRGDGVSHPAVTINRIDFSLAVSPGQSGDYQCSPHGDQTKVLAKVRLHTLDVSAEQEGRNLTVSCLLTCALDRCDEDVTLGWTWGSQYACLSGGIHTTKNTITSQLFTAEVHLSGAVCSVYKDGVLMASKTWSSTNRAAPAAAWLALPLGLLLCATVGGLYFHFKKKTEKGNEAVGMGMAPVYEVIPDQEKTIVQYAICNSDDFYDLLQAVD